MRIHGDKTEDVTIIEKILRSMTPKFNFVVCSIEESKDIDELSIEELQGSLQVHEQKINQQEKEEQALKASTDNHSSTPNRGRGRGRLNQDRKNLHQTSENYQFHDFQGRGRGRGGYHSTANKPKSGDKYNVECFKCHSVYPTLSKTTPSRAASARMSAQDTVALQAASTRVLMVSITSKPHAEFWFGSAFFSPVKVAVSSRSMDASHP
ncbi:hypothetical protein F0562_008534 [Nyssa sinensis]|uniref:Retrovirus-related Pol polyprotein from transposon TNT 1-94 n=1 Tax=Nyssa sinensis TaxID=561372 RepID=A0A5J5A5Y2_9ASTE|nr:hypothetical protein F0562_008534 [Nyssa sinensis]